MDDYQQAVLDELRAIRTSVECTEMVLLRNALRSAATDHQTRALEARLDSVSNRLVSAFLNGNGRYVMAPFWAMHRATRLTPQ